MIQSINFLVQYSFSLQYLTLPLLNFNKKYSFLLKLFNLVRKRYIFLDKKIKYNTVDTGGMKIYSADLYFCDNIY